MIHELLNESLSNYIKGGKCVGCALNEIPAENGEGLRVCVPCKPNQVPTINSITQIYTCETCPLGEMPLQGTFPLSCQLCPMKVLYFKR